jgi:hypothetical protein
MTTIVTTNLENAQNVRSSAADITGFDVVRTVLGVILLVAAALKGHQLATEPVANRDIFSYRWSLMFQVEFEIFFGLWLLSGLHKRLSWLVAVGCFSMFSCVTLYKGLSGEASCGCFGRVEVSPWYTLILDVAAVTALLIFRPGMNRAYRPAFYRFRLGAVIGLGLAVGVPAGVAMGSFRPATVTGQGDFVGGTRFVILEPQKWVGGRFPLLEHIDIGERLSKGNWIVMLHRHDCHDCAEAVPRYRRMSRTLQDTGLKVALVEIPPNGRFHHQLAGTNGGSLVHGKLNSHKEWFVTTPAVALLADGQVAAAWEAKAPELDALLAGFAGKQNDSSGAPVRHEGIQSQPQGDAG